MSDNDLRWKKTPVVVGRKVPLGAKPERNAVLVMGNIDHPQAATKKRDLIDTATTAQKLVCIVVGVLLTATGTFAVPAGESDSSARAGRSAVAAAKLKTSAPAWIRHYLPDDRYKVAGGIWKFVSTDADTYFHRPDCAHVLRQAAAGVIGFASVEDATEAGYAPDPACTSHTFKVQDSQTGDGDGANVAWQLMQHTESLAGRGNGYGNGDNVTDDEAVRRYKVAWQKYVHDLREWNIENEHATRQYLSLRNAVFNKQAYGIRASSEEWQAMNRAQSNMQRVQASVPRQPVMPRAYAEQERREFAALARGNYTHLYKR
jgi:hypothetical protein